MSTNPNNAVGTNGAYGGRTSVEAFNDVLNAFQTPGIISGFQCYPSSGMTVTVGGVSGYRDAAIAAAPGGARTTINNRTSDAIEVTIGTAPAANSRIDAIVAYVQNPPQGSETIVDNPAACGLIVVEGTVAASPSAPTESMIRAAITEDGATGSTAYYVVLATVRVPAGVTTITSNYITQGAFAQVGTDRIADEAVTSDKIDFTTLNKIYNNEVTAVGKTYTVSVSGVYLAWGTSANPSNGSVPTVTITMGGVVRAKSVNVSNGLWASATAVAVCLLNSGDEIVVSQENANATDNRSSVGMCLVQRTQ